MIVLRNVRGNRMASIAGDTLDLRQLYHAVFHYADLYFNRANPVTKDMPIDLENNHVLSLAYDLRKAYQGDRSFLYANINKNYLFSEAKSYVDQTLRKEVEGILSSLSQNPDNHTQMQEILMKPEIFDEDPDFLMFKKVMMAGSLGNLYFSVRIEYPWLFWLLLELQSMINFPVSSDMLEKAREQDPGVFPDTASSLIQIETDKAVIQNFISACWKGIASWMEEPWMKELIAAASLFARDVYDKESYSCAAGYWYWNHGKTSLEKKEQLAAILWNLIGERIPDEPNLCRLPISMTTLQKDVVPKIEALLQRLKEEGRPCPEPDEWNEKLIDLFERNGGSLYQEEITELMEQEFGELKDVEIRCDEQFNLEEPLETGQFPF